MMWKIVFAVLAAVFTVDAARMVGGYQDINVNDTSYADALNFSVVQHNRKSNDMFQSQVAKVIKAERQVVAGMKYRITVTMAKTSCRKNRTNEECGIHQDLEQAKPYQCTFTVWSKPWLNFMNLEKEEC